VQPPFGMRTLQYIDFSNENLRTLNYNQLIQRLKELQSEVEKPTLPSIVTTEEMVIDGANPFTYGSRVSENLFFGRDAAIKEVVQRIGATQLQSASIVGNRRMGKSSFLNYLAKRGTRHLSGQRNWIFIYLDMMSARAKTPVSIMAAMRRFFLKSLPNDLHEFIWAENDDSLSSFETTIDFIMRVLRLFCFWMSGKRYKHALN